MSRLVTWIPVLVATWIAGAVAWVAVVRLADPRGVVLPAALVLISATYVAWGRRRAGGRAA